MINDTIITQSFLSFSLGGEIFAANVAKVKEILEVTKLTKVPKSPDYLKGVINLRGTVLPVIDTRVKFGFPETEDTVDTCIIVLTLVIDGDEVSVGALVDTVSEVFETNSEEILPPVSIGNKFRSDFIEGLIKLDDQFIMLLDVDKVFTDEELLVVKETGEETTI
ncbi:MAG: chemotaxis protein CheW [Thalassobius sp.]|nr:chemotaxis protein CheW [Thalassovita sp.]